MRQVMQARYPVTREEPGDPDEVLQQVNLTSKGIERTGKSNRQEFNIENKVN